MIDFPILRSLGIILIVAALLLLAARRFGVPHLIAYLVAGLLLGPATGIIHPDEAVELTAEAGIVLLLFLVGLELTLARIRNLGRTVLIAGTLQVALSAAAAAVAVSLAGFDTVPAIMLGIALSFSSTVVVVKLLAQKKELGSLHGRLAVGILLVQDLIVILALTVLVGLGGPSGLNIGSLASGLLRAFAGTALLLAVSVAAARWVLPRVLDWLGRARDALLIFSLAWCFALAVIGARLGLSAEIGAFLAGVSLAQCGLAGELHRRVEPLSGFFLAVFFVSLGLHIDLAAALAEWPTVLALSLIMVALKTATVALPLLRLGYDAVTTLKVGIVLAQISEFSFILIGLAAERGLVDDTTVAVIAATGLLTIAGSSFMIVNDHRIVARLLGRERARASQDRVVDEAATPPRIVVVGMNALGRLIVEELHARNQRVLAIDTDPAKLAGLPVETMVGSVDSPAVLEKAGVANAKLVVSALQIEDTNNLLTYRCRRAGIPISVHAFDTSVVPTLEELGANHVMLSKHLGVRLIAQALRERQVLS
ncbi:MAG: cation:proton antiporter [Longimicrobiales bacterium]